MATRPKTAGNWLVEQLRADIISGNLPPGEPIRQEEVAEKFSVSRMPVRQALDILAAEGWVEQRPHRGAVVVPLNAEDALELFEVRSALESLAVQRSFPRLTESQFEAIDEAWEQYRSGSGDLSVHHQSLHLALYAAAGPRLLRLVMQQIDAAHRYLLFESSALKVSKADNEEHEALIAAAKARDVKRGVKLIEAHVLGGGRGIAASLERRQPAERK